MATKGVNPFAGKESFKEEFTEAKNIKSGKISPKQYAKGEQKEESNKKDKMPKFAKGGSVDGAAQRGKTRGKCV